MGVNESFGKRIKARRKALHLSLSDLATRARISSAALIDIEADVYFPRLHELERLLAALRVKLAALQAGANRVE